MQNILQTYLQMLLLWCNLDFEFMTDANTVTRLPAFTFLGLTIRQIEKCRWPSQLSLEPVTHHCQYPGSTKTLCSKDGHRTGSCDARNAKDFVLDISKDKGFFIRDIASQIFCNSIGFLRDQISVKLVLRAAGFSF